MESLQNIFKNSESESTEYKLQNKHHSHATQGGESVTLDDRISEAFESYWFFGSVVFIASGLISYFMQLNPKPSAKSKFAEPVARSLNQDSWDRVDEASWESFPASDPPAYSRRTNK